MKNLNNRMMNLQSHFGFYHADYNNSQIIVSEKGVEFSGACSDEFVSNNGSVFRDSLPSDVTDEEALLRVLCYYTKIEGL